MTDEPKPRTVFGSVLASIAATEDMKDKWFRELLEEKADDDDDRG